MSFLLNSKNCLSENLIKTFIEKVNAEDLGVYKVSEAFRDQKVEGEQLEFLFSIVENGIIIEKQVALIFLKNYPNLGGGPFRSSFTFPF